MLGCSICTLPFSAPCNDMLTMFVRATRWLSMHLYTLAYMSMHEFCLLMCRSCFNTIKLWTFDPNLHLSPADTTFCLLFHLFAFLLAFLLLCLPCILCLSALCLFICSLYLFLPLLVYKFSCLCLCMYTHGVRTHEARAWSPRRKQKRRVRKHVDIRRAAMFSRLGV